jgi:NADH:ubiquinone oxidoreductase subunit 3 (subunit A)
MLLATLTTIANLNTGRHFTAEQFIIGGILFVLAIIWAVLPVPLLIKLNQIGQILEAQQATLEEIESSLPRRRKHEDNGSLKYHFPDAKMKTPFWLIVLFIVVCVIVFCGLRIALNQTY